MWVAACALAVLCSVNASALHVLVAAPTAAAAARFLTTLFFWLCDVLVQVRAEQETKTGPEKEDSDDEGPAMPAALAQQQQKQVCGWSRGV